MTKRKDPFIAEIRKNPELLRLAEYRAGTDVERCIEITRKVLVEHIPSEQLAGEYELSGRRIRKLVKDHVERCKQKFLEVFALG